MSAEKKEELLRQELTPGSRVRLDQGFSNSSIVEVVEQTPKRLYTTVRVGDEHWQVMTYRLTKLTP